MRTTWRFSLLRRLLFPYSGEDALSLKQSARVMLGWAIVLPLIMSLLITPVAFWIDSAWQHVLSMLVFAFLSGMGIFGILGLLIIVVNNQSARIRRAWKTRQGQQ
jgi:hypothetical protein